MSGPFVIKPIDGWQAGDRAYCVHGSRRTVPSLEAGRVYRVASVTHVPGHVDCGLEIEGITLPDPMRGMWSNRFVKLRPAKALSRRSLTSLCQHGLTPIGQAQGKRHIRTDD